MLRLSFVFALVSAAAAVAHAQPDKRAQALQLADESERAYKAGQFEKSAALLRKAHAAYPEPILLYNLGRALEGMGDNQGAVDAYEQYLKEAKQIDDRPAIERRIATLKAQIDKARDDAAKAAQEQQDQQREQKERDAAEQALRDQQAKDQAAREQAERDAKAREQQQAQQAIQQRLQQPSPPPEPGALSHYGPWATIGAGGAMVVTGALFGWRANVNHDNAVAEPTQTTALADQNAAQSDATVANVMFIAGGAALLGGAIWEYFEWQREAGMALGQAQPGGETAGVRVHISPTGVALQWTLR
jgi:tetratricopeptide (TPR) repeat protein